MGVREKGVIGMSVGKELTKDPESVIFDKAKFYRDVKVEFFRALEIGPDAEIMAIVEADNSKGWNPNGKGSSDE